MNKLTIKVERFQNLITILDDKRKVLRLAVIVCVLGMALFFGITMLCLQLKKTYTYSDITTNAFGATTIADEQKEVSYFLFNTAELWANSGIDVQKGDIISVYSSGSAHTAIHHLAKSASDNYKPNEDYFDARGQRTREGVMRDLARRKFRLAADLPQSALVMQVYNKNGKPLRRPSENDSNFYYISQHRENILINQGGKLYFAVNDIVLDPATIVKMKKRNYEMMDSVSKGDNTAQVFLHNHKTELTKPKLAKGEGKLSKTEYKLYQKLLKESPMKFGPYYYTKEERAKGDTLTLKTEMDYYIENNYDKAWYDDNVGSFLIVIEKKDKDRK